MTSNISSSTDQPATTNEFQRADSAPRSSSGDGVLTVSDITQAERYVAGFDPLQAAGGAISPSLTAISAKNTSAFNVLTTREIRPLRVVRNGNKLVVAVELETGSGEEPANAVGFTLNFDPLVLSNPSNIFLGSGAGGATLIANPNQAAQGRLGIVIYKPVNQTFPSGVQRLITIEFDVASNAPNTTTLDFGDQPVVRDISDVNANSLPANFAAANISLLQPTAASVAIGGRVTDASGNPIKSASLLLVDGSGVVRTALTNPFGYYRFEGVQVGTTVVISVTAKGVSFTPNTRVLSAEEDIFEVNFVSDG